MVEFDELLRLVLLSSAFFVVFLLFTAVFAGVFLAVDFLVVLAADEAADFLVVDFLRLDVVVVAMRITIAHYKES